MAFLDGDPLTDMDPAGTLAAEGHNARHTEANGALREIRTWIGDVPGTYVPDGAVFLGIGDFTKGFNGSAAIGKILNAQVWLLDPAGTENLTGGTHEPARRGWATFDVSILWAPSDASAAPGSTDGVSLTLDYGSAAVGETIGRDAQPTVTATASATQGELHKTTIASAVAVVTDGFLNFIVQRSGGAGADTYAADIGIYGLLIEKAS